MQNKVLSLEEIAALIDQLKAEKKRIVQCHGVFDLLHPGHIRHFKEAKQQGDCLIVSVTPDRFVNKGPGRPAFPEQLRLESLAALGCVDYVVLNDAPDAVRPIRVIRPHVYVKGIEYKDHQKDVTGKIQEEASAVEEHGGEIFYTDDIVFSSSSLLNRHFDPPCPKVSRFVEDLKKRHTTDHLLERIEELARLKVLVVGDAIIDLYQYVSPLGQSGKGLHMTARCLDQEVFLGGSLIIANHLAQFAGEVALLTGIGKSCPFLNFIEEALDPKINRCFLKSIEDQTLTKKRYVLKDGHILSKLFETYSPGEHLLSEEEEKGVIQFLQESARDYDLVLVCDFGNGFTTPNIISTLSSLSTFLAVNTQTNSGNRGYNVVTHYQKADFISLNEPELRLAAHDRHNPLLDIVERVSSRLNCPHVSVTRGVNGVLCYTQGKPTHEIPSLTQATVDRVGAGDCYFSVAALSLAAGHSHALAGFLGSLASGMGVQIVGNREPVHKSALCKYLQRVMK